MTMMIIKLDVCTEVCCKTQFRNRYLELSVYGMSGIKPLGFCMLTAVDCTYLPTLYLLFKVIHGTSCNTF